MTPTSYLALLGTFKSLLKDKKNEIINMKSRYEMGLGKLEFASNQVRICNNPCLYIILLKEIIFQLEITDLLLSQL